MRHFFLISLLSTIVAFSQTIGKEEYEKNLKGPVKSIRIVTYKALDKGGGHYDKGDVEKGMDNFLVNYDRKGNMIKKTAYYPNGSIWWTANYIYEGSDVKKKEPPLPKITIRPEKGEEGFKGKVTYRYDKKGQKTEEASYDAKGVLLWRYVYRYDNKGNQIERDSFDSQGNLIGREQCRYDLRTNLILEKTINTKSQLAYQCKWEYDDKGKVIKKEEYFTDHIAPEKINSLIEDELRIKGVLWKKFVYSYDSKGNRTEVNVYDAKESERSFNSISSTQESPKEEKPKQPSYDELPNPKLFFVEEYNNVGALWKKDVYTYDQNGKITQVKTIDNKSKPQFNYTYMYDDKGNEIERAIYDHNDKLMQRTIFTYDDKGNITEMIEYDAQGALSQKETYKYDDKGKKVEQQGYNLNGSLAYTFKYFYNPKGELIETRTFNQRGDLTSKLTQHFKVDAYKNWIERIQYTDGKGSYITERIIEYHEKI